MNNIFRHTCCLIMLSVCVLATKASAQVYSDDDKNTLLLTTEFGTTVIRLYPHIAPRHVRRIKELVRSGYYKGSTFHRVIPGFIAQTGDPSGENKGSGKKIRAEFSKQKHLRGTVSMARYEGKHSADDQFFICLQSAPHLDGKYTIFGHVVAGLDFIDQVKEGDPTSGSVDDPTKVQGIWLASDAVKTHKDTLDKQRKERRKATIESRQRAWDRKWDDAANPQ